MEWIDYALSWTLWAMATAPLPFAAVWIGMGLLLWAIFGPEPDDPEDAYPSTQPISMDIHSYREHVS